MSTPYFYFCEVCGNQRIATNSQKKICLACNIKAKKQREKNKFFGPAFRVFKVIKKAIK